MIVFLTTKPMHASPTTLADDCMGGDDDLFLRRVRVSRKQSMMTTSLSHHLLEDELGWSSSSSSDDDIPLLLDASLSSKSHLSVSFHEEPQIQMIPTIDEYTRDELESMFYIRDDYEDILEGAEIAASGWMSKDDTHRGLERFTMEGRRHSKDRKRAVISAVLEEQWRHHSEEGEKQKRDPPNLVLAQVSRRLSVDCQNLAYERAYQDELESLPRQTREDVKPSFLSRWSMVFQPLAFSRKEQAEEETIEGMVQLIV
ncbi:expressed unknown protein [Seminavis robusta]|uniref:Uncharacterized protein n=1 Tax=Seminavis robusta TaxID=568900 RepID=A0A9N8HXF6_9STRA|nr:expressed unknown protein [Seminavis robusta]|eukprot:Sro2443_g327850.1 n/a (257) ;mRNA; f:6797-7567